MPTAETSVRIIDADTHLTEPPDLWSARLPQRFRADAPRVVLDEKTNAMRWRIGDRWATSVGMYSVAGWPEAPPSLPPTLEEANPAAYDAGARLRHMDEHGIFAQILYPNLLTFEGFAFLGLRDEEFRLACVRTYNDYQAEFASVAPNRFVQLAVLPFWDVEESIKELRRCHAMGHRGVVWGATFGLHGLPEFTDPHWDPFYAVAQELHMSMNFHIGVGATREAFEKSVEEYQSGTNLAAGALTSTMTFVNNARTIATLITSGLCERFPTLDFVSVESGFGYVPFLLDALDWQWTNVGARSAHPERLMPSEYFRRQIYAMFWFETEALDLLPKYQDNVMFETDFPHPTCLHPGPPFFPPSPAEVIDRATGIVGPAVMSKVLHDTPVRVYDLDVD